MMNTKNKFQMDTQIKLPTKSESSVLPQLGKTKTFQKDNPKLYKLLGHSSIKATKIYIQAANLVAGVRRPLDG
ncbi:MAG: hypothetical protein ACYC6P_09680 [Ignavibacteriaceae bacterium]